MANTLRFKRGLASGIINGALGEPLFTTDTFDLYIGNGTTNTRFQKYIASGTTSQLLRGDGSLLTMPIVLTSPSNGQVLKYNGTSWVNDSDSGITGTGTTNYLPKFTGASTLGNSNITDDGTTVSLISRALSGTSASFSGNVNADDYNMGAWKALDWVGSAMYIGGISASQWTAIDLYTSGTFKARLDASGNLGLGVVPSAWAVNRAMDIASNGAFFGDGAIYYFSTGIGQNCYRTGNTTWAYKLGVAAARFEINNNNFYWFNAPTGSAGANITFTQAMTLTANGRLLLGTTSEGTQRLQVNGTSAFYDSLSIFNERLYLDYTSAVGGLRWSLNPFISGVSNGGFEIYDHTNAVSRFVISSNGNVGIGTTSPQSNVDILGSSSRLRLDGSAGSFQILSRNTANTSTNPLIFDADTYTYNRGGLTQMTLDASGRLSIGSGSVTSELLQVNGTMKVTGASTFASSVSATSLLQVTHSANNWAGKVVTSGGDELQLSGNITGNDNAPSIRAVTSGGAAYSILTLDGSQLKFKVSGTQRLGIDTTGAATFSSSVTANGGRFNSTGTLSYGLAAIGTSGGARPIFIAGQTGFSNGFTVDYNGSAMEYIFLDGNVGIGGGPSYKLDVTGEARVSNAIAIGTTPDTNKPFKILKNINGTVGINFENTSTGSLAFSAIQMGTDVTGGTKFTNLVYSSSGVTASGVYQPDGTSLINNGAGGLNFLGNPIRMYTGGSNGTLRWDMTNDGFITQYTGTNPSTNATDGYRQYSADVVAGNAAPHFRTENGAVIKLYQETTAVGNAIFSQGGGNSVLDDSTFAGYTIRQVVQALRNQGILQ